jgi:hypothetical protein
MKHPLLSALSCAFLLSFAVSEASAGDLLKCEKKLSPPRSKISVEAEGLKRGALYTAIVKSGKNSILVSRAANALGVFKVEFDSNPKDILAGKTKISPAFISGAVNVLVTNALGNTVDETSVLCKVK